MNSSPYLPFSLLARLTDFIRMQIRAGRNMAEHNGRVGARLGRLCCVRGARARGRAGERRSTGKSRPGKIPWNSNSHFGATPRRKGGFRRLVSRPRGRGARRFGITRAREGSPASFPTCLLPRRREICYYPAGKHRKGRSRVKGALAPRARGPERQLDEDWLGESARETGMSRSLLGLA